MFRPSHDDTGSPLEWRALVVLPFVRGVSELLRQILTPFQLWVCFTPFRTIGQYLSRAKEQIPDLDRSDVVYRVPCAVCSPSYVGQTCCRLSQRLSEYQRAVVSCDLNTSTWILAWIFRMHICCRAVVHILSLRMVVE